MEGSYPLCADFHWMQVAVIGLLITKGFFKDPINVVVYTLYATLLLTIYVVFLGERIQLSQYLRLFTTKAFFFNRIDKN